jgi:hypothetical protein
MIKISSDIAGRIKVVFSYNPEYVAKIKTVNAHRWHPEERYWSFLCSKPILKEILSSFAGEQIDIDPSLQTLVSQNQREKLKEIRTWRKEPLQTKENKAGKEELEGENSFDSGGNNSLFDRVRDLIRLKHYSIRTEKSYLSWIMRYMLFHNKRDPKEMANPEIEAFLSHLAVACKRYRL